jgi:hypothetical protein
MERRGDCKQQEVLVITLANAGADPWAVVVVDFNAGFTVAAVERTRRLYNVTSPTDVH